MKALLDQNQESACGLRPLGSGRINLIGSNWWANDREGENAENRVTLGHEPLFDQKPVKKIFSFDFLTYMRSRTSQVFLVLSKICCFSRFPNPQIRRFSLFSTWPDLAASLILCKLLSLLRTREVNRNLKKNFVKNRKQLGKTGENPRKVAKS